MDTGNRGKAVHKFWGWLGLNLGKHWIVVLTVGAVLTVGLGYGITNLKFATGQDSYLNKSDQVYKDSVAYQKLFGGQAMLTLVTMDKGHTVNELFTPENIAQWNGGREEAPRQRQGRERRQPADRVAVQRRAGARSRRRPDPGGRGQDPARRRPRQTVAGGQAARNATRSTTLTRISAIPVAERTLDNPAYVDFLLHDNQGKIRKPLLANFPDDRHAQIVTRLPGNESIEDEGKASVFVQDAAKELKFDNASIVTTGAPVLLKNVNDYLTGGMLTLGAIAVGDHGADPAGALQRAVAAARPRRRGHRRHLGVRHRRLPRHPADDRHHRRPAGDARHRHRLRDPDARPGRGGGRRRPGRPPDPGDLRATSVRRCSS